MTSIWAVMVVMASVLYSSPATPDQDKPVWVDEVERALNEGGWQSVRKRTYVEEKTKRFLSVTIQLVNGETDATIDIKLKASTKEARDQFKSAVTAYKVTNKPITLNKFSGLGEENLLTRPGLGWLRITFRKGRAYIDVLALSEDTARSVAQLVADKIPDRN